MDWIYLDNNATTQPAPQVLAATQEIHRELWANPSSVHRFGQLVRQRIELARSSLAQLIGARDREIVFTSGGTESNNLALRGVLGWQAAKTAPPESPSDAPGRVLITTPIEHSAIRTPAEELEREGVRVVRLPVDRDGLLSPGDLATALQDLAAVPGGRTVLVSVQWANNETGVIQKVAELGAICREAAGRGGVPGLMRIVFHVDATQAVGKIPVDVRGAGADLLTLAGHKFHGPKGVGALFVRSGVRLRPINLGGPQERQRRGGTENTAGIVGLGVAADLARQFLADPARIAHLRGLRDRFERAILEAVPAAVVNSGGVGLEGRLWNTSNLGFVNLEAEAILLGLSEQGVCASAGAACSSGSLEPSPVLLAMGIPEPVAHGSVRFSLSRFTTDREIEQAIQILPQVVRRLAQVLPMGAS